MDESIGNFEHRIRILEAKFKALYQATEDVVKAADVKFENLKRRVKELENKQVGNNLDWLIPKAN